MLLQFTDVCCVNVIISSQMVYMFSIPVGACSSANTQQTHSPTMNSRVLGARARRRRVFIYNLAAPRRAPAHSVGCLSCRGSHTKNERAFAVLSFRHYAISLSRRVFRFVRCGAWGGWWFRSFVFRTPYAIYI